MMRVDLDQYFTPPVVASALMPYVADPIVNGKGAIIEPSAGALHFVEALKRAHPPCASRILALELDPTAANRSPWQHDATLIGDTLSRDFRNLPIDLIVGNPPYLKAAEFWQWALDQLSDGGHILFLLRVGFANSLARAPMFRAQPPRLIFINPRPSFIRKSGRNGKINQTDPHDYAGFHLIKSHPMGGNAWLTYTDVEGCERAARAVGLNPPPRAWRDYVPPLFDANMREIEPPLYT